MIPPQGETTTIDQESCCSEGLILRPFQGQDYRNQGTPRGHIRKNPEKSIDYFGNRFLISATTQSI